VAHPKDDQDGERLRAVFDACDAGTQSKREISKHFGIPYRTLMRKLAAREAANAVPEDLPETIELPAPPDPLPQARSRSKADPPEPPTIIVLTGETLDVAQRGLEAAVRYLAQWTTNLDPSLDRDPAYVRALGTAVVPVLEAVVTKLEKAAGTAGRRIATLSDEALLEEAKKAAQSAINDDYVEGETCQPPTLN
jgi:hypothetical protein